MANLGSYIRNIGIIRLDRNELKYGGIQSEWAERLSCHFIEGNIVGKSHELGKYLLIW